MLANEAVANQGLDDMMKCPRCKGRFSRGEHSLTCTVCNSTFGIGSGKIPVYDLYYDEQQASAGRETEQVWDLGSFERGYENIGYHESGVDFEKQLGYPEEVSRFHFERVKKNMLDWVRPADGHRILDIGCGSGYFLYLIREKYKQQGFNPMLTGVDVSINQLSYMARRMYKEEVFDAVAVRGNGEYLPFDDNTFDLLTCSEVLEHISNPAKALSEMQRVLKPGGLILLSTPSMMAEKAWSIVLAPVVTLVKFVSGYRSEPKTNSAYDLPWYPKELKEAVLTAQFEINDFVQNGIIPHPYYFKFIPKPLVRPVMLGFEFADRYMRFALKPLASHLIVNASKRSGVTPPFSKERGL